jgi:glycosyltransferase involved in cell wall biosynthesis
LLKALAKLNDKINWNLDVLGQGTQTKTWKNLAQKLSIGSNCNWHGWIPKDKAIMLMNEAHIFVITSLKDLTSSVTLEALSNGIPIICLEHCGFADVVTPDCGIKIPLSSPRQVTIDIERAIDKLWSDEAYRQKLAIGALKRAREFSWEKKMETLNDIYAKKLQKKLILSSKN